MKICLSSELKNKQMKNLEPTRGLTSVKYFLFIKLTYTYLELFPEVIVVKNFDENLRQFLIEPAIQWNILHIYTEIYII